MIMYGNVAKILEEPGDDQIRHVLREMRLERNIVVIVLDQICEPFLDLSTECNPVGVVSYVIEPSLDFVGEKARCVVGTIIGKILNPIDNLIPSIDG